MSDALEALLNSDPDKMLEGLESADEPTPVEKETTLENVGTDAPEEEEEITVDPAAELKKQLDDIQRERDGLLKGMKDERRKRQEFQGRFDQLSQTVNAILEQRSRGAADQTGADSTKVSKGIQVEFDEDGNAFLPEENMQAVLTPYQKKIMELEQKLAATSGQMKAETEGQRVLQQILSEDAAFPAAHAEYVKAREWANQRVVDYQLDNNLTGPMNGEQALDLVFDETAEAEFTKAFPGADLDAVVGNSQRAFRKALRSLAPKETAAAEPTTETAPTQKATTDSRFQKVLNKPSGLGSAKNSKSAPALSERVGQLSHQDILSLNDSDIEALQEAMLAEEKSEGIRFK